MDEKIFISYSRKDKEKVFAIRDEIESRVGKGSCWIDLTGIESDQQFEDTIISAINRTEVFLFMYSANSAESKWVKDELRFADKKKKRIVILSIDRSELKDWFQFKFGGHDIIDYCNKDQKGKVFDNLCTWCSVDLGQKDFVAEEHQDPRVQNKKGKMALLSDKIPSEVKSSVSAAVQLLKPEIINTVKQYVEESTSIDGSLDVSHDSSSNLGNNEEAVSKSKFFPNIVSQVIETGHSSLDSREAKPVSGILHVANSIAKSYQKAESKPADESKKGSFSKLLKYKYGTKK